MPESWTVFVAANDPEAEAIVRLAETRNCRVKRLTLDRGRPLEPSQVLSAELGDTVVLVELPSREVEARLRALGKTVHIVDHHLWLGVDGGVLDRRHARTSLEQVAALLGDPALSPEDRLISANERGFIPGLARELAARGPSATPNAEPSIRDLRRKEGDWDEALAWVRGAKAAKKLAVLDTGRAAKGDPCLILLHAPEEHRKALADAVCWWWHETDKQQHPLDQPVEFLAVFSKPDVEQAVSCGLMFSGQGERLDLIRQIVTEPDAPGRRLTQWTHGGEAVSFFEARDDLGGEHDEVDRLADRFLDELLTGNRPVVSWRTHFLQALTVENDVSRLRPKAPWRPEEPSRQHRRYFLNHVRDLLAPKGDDPCYVDAECADRDLHLRSFEWLDPGLSMRVRIPSKDGTKSDVTTPIRAVRVHLLMKHLIVVEWECRGGLCGHETPGKIAFQENEIGYWRQLLDWQHNVCQARLEDYTLSNVAQVLDFNWAARFTSSPYINPGESAAITLLDKSGTELDVLKLGEEVSEGECDGAFAGLLKRMENHGIALTKPTPVFDERARVVSGLVGVGHRPSTPLGRELADIVLARLSTVDGYGTTHAYDFGFSQTELEKATYDRFVDMGSRYAINDQSFVLAAYGAFPAKYILSDHLPALYRRLMLIATVYAAALNQFALEIAEKSRAGIGDRDVRDLRSRFVRFANGLWFEHVTSQLQGRELFNRVRDASPIRAEYEEIKAEIERTDELLDAIKTQRWQWMGGVGFALTLATGILGVNFIDGKELSVPFEILIAIATTVLALLFVWRLWAASKAEGFRARMWAFFRPDRVWSYAMLLISRVK